MAARANMSRNDDQHDPIPDEPPPPYEPLEQSAQPSSSSAPTASSAAPSSAGPTSSNAANTASGSSALTIAPSTASHTSTSSAHNPFLAPEEQQPSAQATASAAAGSTAPPTSTNPFLSSISPQPTGGSATSTTVSATPALPPRTYAATSPPLSSPAPSVVAPSQPSRPSIESHQSHHSRHSSNAAPLSPPLASPSVFSPPQGPPPPSSSSSQRPGNARPSDSYRPTTVPTPGQPLLRKGKLLVYPRNWAGCAKCHDTGYKHGDPNNPHKSCWDKYGKTYTSAMSYSGGLNDATSNFQKPLPVLAGPPGMVPGHGPRPSHGHVPGGYPGATGHFAPAAHAYGGYAPPVQAPPQAAAAARPPRTPTTPNVDAETEGARMSDVPPNYQDASNVSSNERLPSQYVPPSMPPPGHPGSPPPPRPPHGPPGGYPYGSHGPPPGPPGGFVGGFGPNPGGPNPYVSVQPQQAWYGARPPPPGALVVMPGDPRIGGRLCFECGGRGLTESFWFGDETCLRCRGSGRIF